MGHHTLPGNPPVTVKLRHSARARRITLRVSSLDSTVTLTVPRGVSEKEALNFAHEKRDWVRGHIAQHSAPVRVERGARLPIEGVDREIVAGSGRGVQLTEESVLVPGADERVASRLMGFLKTLARTRLADASDTYASALGTPYHRITLRDTRSRWGSCSSQGALMYSWRLILAPPPVLRYVAAHEVAHLAEMNHSPAFWAVVERLYGPCDAERRWLRQEGAALHRIRFD